MSPPFSTYVAVLGTAAGALQRRTDALVRCRADNAGLQNVRIAIRHITIFIHLMNQYFARRRVACQYADVDAEYEKIEKDE